MKPIFCKWVIISSLIFTSCEILDSDGNGDPKHFGGQVVFTESEEIPQGIIQFLGIKDNFPSDDTIIAENIILNNEGAFSVSFLGNSDIDYFAIGFIEITNDSSGIIPFNTVSCEKLNCSENNINPGRQYEDIVITIDY